MLEGKKDKAITLLNRDYPFTSRAIHARKYTDSQKLKVFLRDHFIDRYTGDKLVIPGILKVLSHYFPREFPYHPHWKMDQTHIAYWELVPTIDHVVPIALGGSDCEDNWATTSMLHNAIKSNWTLEQVGWRVLDLGDREKWDGLMQLFLHIVDQDKSLRKDTYINRWYELVKTNIT